MQNKVLFILYFLLFVYISARTSKTKKPGAEYQKIFRHPGCLHKTLWAFRPVLANGLVLSSIRFVLRLKRNLADSVPFFNEK
jgi:uncharacterized membrane protein